MISQKVVVRLSLILLTVLSLKPSFSKAGIQQFSDNFENPSRGWFFAGGAGFDMNKGLAHRGKGNAWVRNTTGWNAINHWVTVPPHSHCYVNAWLRLSPYLLDGYISVRNDKDNRPDHNFDVINERRLVGPSAPNFDNAGYNQYPFEFESGGNTRVLFYVGLWGNGQDNWIQIDDMSVSCKTPY
jgi:hypothetical protein